MAIQQVNLGTYANDGTGDDLRTAFTKVNSNFAELDTLTIVGGTNLGSGSPVFANVVADAGTGNKLSFRSISAGTNIVVSNDSNTISITTTGTITANLTGNVAGNVTGNLTGNVAGNVTGNLTGNVTGQVSDITNHKLSALEDVSNFEPVDGQFLRYSSGLWSYTGINSDMIDEGASRLYFTNYRARQSISVSGDLSYDNITGILSYTAPTNLSQFINDSQYITSATLTSYVNNSISTLINGAPAFLDTLNEISQAINNDQNFAATITNQLALKANTSSLAIVAISGNYNDLTNRPIESIPGSTIDLGSIIPRQISSLLELVIYSANIDLGTFIDPLPLLYDAGTI